MLDQDGRLIGVLSVGRKDVTEIFGRAKPLREREEIFSSFVSQAADSVGVVDLQKPGGSSVQHRRPPQPGVQPRRVRPPDGGGHRCHLSPDALRRHPASMATPVGVTFETRQRHRDGRGQRDVVSARGITVRGENHYFAAIWTDITDSKAQSRSPFEADQRTLRTLQRMQPGGGGGPPTRRRCSIVCAA